MVGTLSDAACTQVSEIEFVRGVLVKMGKVLPNEFDQIREQFKQFDADNSGAISREEIMQRSQHTTPSGSVRISAEGDVPVSP
jgi:Ca2+-binding EF-hand superfamily protein